MNTYELTLITKTEADVAAGKKYIEEFGGQVLEQKPSATRPLAYPVKKETQGTFTVFRFSMEPEQVFAMNKKLVLDDTILRHLVTTAPAVKVAQAAELGKRVAVEEVIGITKVSKKEAGSKKQEKTEKKVSAKVRKAKLDRALEKLIKE